MYIRERERMRFDYLCVKCVQTFQTKIDPIKKNLFSANASKDDLRTVVAEKKWIIIRKFKNFLHLHVC